MSAIVPDQPRPVRFVEREMYCPRCRRFLGLLALPAETASGWQRVSCHRCGKFVVVQITAGVIRGVERVLD